MRTSESISKIAPALLKAQRAMTGKVEKNGYNPHFKSNFSDLNSVREACVPAFNDAGISVLQPTVVVDGKNYVNTILLHESGEFISSLTEIKVEKQNNPQAEGTGISYARRYGLQSLANLASVDDDAESAVGRGVVGQSPKAEPVKPKSITEQFKEAQAAAPTEKKTGKFAPKATTPAKSNTDIEL
jgi:hypothetical protein